MLWDDFFDTTLGSWTPKKDEYGLDEYSFDATSGEAPSSTMLNQSGVFDIENISTAEIEAWWLGFQPDSGLDRHTKSTVIDPCDGQHGDAPEQAECSIPDPSVVPYPAEPYPHPPGTSSSPVPTPSWSDPAHSTETYTVADNWHQHDTRDQPPLPQDTCAQSADKGKGRATDHIPPVEPQTISNTMWQHQMWAPENYDPSLDLRMSDGVQGSSSSAQIASSTGPQRSAKCAKEKERGKGGGRQKRVPQKCLPVGIDWYTTNGRFCAEMDRIYLHKPTGEVPNLETAYAEINKFIQDDLYLSPLVAKELGYRPCRDLEQYLAGVLNELRPRISGQRRGIQYTLERVERELADGLVAVNDHPTLLENPLSDADPVTQKVDDSEKGGKQRGMEQARRNAIRGSFERMTLLFRRPTPRYLWTRPQVLFYAITYLLFGAQAFGDGVFFTPKPQL